MLPAVAVLFVSLKVLLAARCVYYVATQSLIPQGLLTLLLDYLDDHESI